MHLSPYLFFTAQCGPALVFYAECGLGRVTEQLRYDEGGMPSGSDAMRGKILHARFEGPGILFFASDNDDAEPMRGSAMIVMMDSRQQVAELFGRLGQGGRSRRLSPSSPGATSTASSPTGSVCSGC